MEPELEGGGHAEVAAAAPQRPEQVRVLVRGGAHDLAVRGHQLDRQQVVAGQAVLALEPARAAAQGQPGHAGAGHASTGGGEPVRLGGAVDVGPGGAARRRGRSAGRDRPRPRPCRARRSPGRRPRGTGRPRSGRRRARRPRGRARARSASAALTSSGLAQRATAAGRRSIMLLKSVRASSYSALPGLCRGRVCVCETMMFTLGLDQRARFAIPGHPAKWPEPARPPAVRAQSRPARAA